MSRLDFYEPRKLSLPIVEMANTAIIPCPDVERSTEMMRVALEARILRDSAGGPFTKTEQRTYAVEETNFPRWIPRWLQRRWTKTSYKTVEASLTIEPYWVYPDYLPNNTLGREILYINDEPIKWTE